MTSQALASIVTAAVVTILASWIFFKALPDYRVDIFRQNMFTLRDDLFDYAADGNIPFEDPAYVLLRQQMNALIRYGHQITLWRSLMTRAVSVLLKPKGGESWLNQWESALLRVKDERVRDRLKSFQELTELASAKHLVTGSIPLILVVLVVATGAAVYELLRRGWIGMRHVKRYAFSQVLVGPINPQQIDENAFTASV